MSMAEFLNVRELLFIGSVVALLMFLSLLQVCLFGKTYAGFRSWTIASMCNFSGTAMLCMRGYLPDILSIVVANMVIAVCYALIVHGMVLFSGMRWERPYLLWVPLIVQSFLTLYFTYVIPSIEYRITVIAAVGILYMTMAFYVSVRYIPQLLKAVNWPMTVVFGFAIIIDVFMIAYTLITNIQGVDFMVYPGIHGANMLGKILVFLTVYIGVIILNSQRVEYDLSQSLREMHTLRGLLPICSICKRIRDSEGYWQDLERYLSERSGAVFSHSVCGDCAREQGGSGYLPEAE